MRVGQLAEKHNLSLRQVTRILKDYATEVRSKVTDLISRTFALQAERLERMYGIVELEMQAYEEYMKLVRAAQGVGEGVLPIKFDDRPFRVAVMIMDRQAKLMGIDGGGGGAGKSPADWMSGAPISEVISAAKQLKMTLPSEFET